MIPTGQARSDRRRALSPRLLWILLPLLLAVPFLAGSLLGFGSDPVESGPMICRVVRQPFINEITVRGGDVLRLEQLEVD